MRVRAVPAVVAGVLLFVAVIMGLGAGAWRAQQLHRRAVLAHLDFLAAVAVDRYAVALEFAVRQSIVPIFPVRTLEPSAPEPPEYLWHMSRVLRTDPCQCLADLTPDRFFTLRLSDGRMTALDSVGRPTGSDPVLSREVKQFADTTTDREYYFAFFLSREQPGMVVVVSAARAIPGKDSVVYGFTFPRDRLVSELAAPLFASFRLVPAYLSDSLENTQYLSFSLQSQGRESLYQSTPQYSPQHHGRKTLAARRGGIQIEASINPAIGDQLVPGGVPSELPLKAFALLALALACLGGVVVGWRRARRLARMRTDFAASVSHELRTPLTQIRLATETLLLGRASSAANRRAILLSVVDETRRLEGLIDSVLLFSRAEHRATEAPPSDQLLGPLIEDVLVQFSPLIARAGSRIEVVIEPGTVVRVNPGALRQILLNLLDNAIRHGPADQTIRLEAGMRASRMELTVANEGPGIAAADRDRAWLPFVRLDEAATTFPGGAGLGLAVVRSLLAVSAGTGRIEDRPGGGTLIRISLPAGPAPAQARTG